MTAPGFDLLVRAVPALAPPLVRGLFWTCRVRIRNRPVWSEYIAGRRAFVGICWHQDFPFVLDHFRRRKIVVLVSRSRDGEIVARTLHRMGYRTARGSSSAGGPEALLEVIRWVRNGWGSAFVADGPRGPARRSKIGPVIAARESGAPIIPFACHAASAWRMRNWDGTVIPRPFSRIAVAYGDPIAVAPEASREECERIRSGLDARMEELEATCRKDAGA